MPMKNPPHPGHLIGDNVEELGLTTAEAAKAFGVTRQQLHNVISGRSAVSPEMAVRLEKALGGSADMWLRLQNAYDLAQVRLRCDELDISRLVPPHVAAMKNETHAHKVKSAGKHD